MAFFKIAKVKPRQESNTYEEELHKEKVQDDQEESDFWKEGSDY